MGCTHAPTRRAQAVGGVRNGYGSCHAPRGGLAEASETPDALDGRGRCACPLNVGHAALERCRSRGSSFVLNSLSPPPHPACRLPDLPY